MPSDGVLPAFYERETLNVATYDARAAREVASSSCAGDVAFFVEEAARRGGPLLELGAGTGRVAIPLAEAGHEVVGLDLSHAMLARAEQRRAALPEPARSRVRFVHGDMSRFDAGGPYGIVFSAFRAFQSMTTPALQRSCLESARRHLVPGGTLILDLFDPRFEYLTPGAVSSPRPTRPTTQHPVTGNDVWITVLGRTNDPCEQVFTETWRFEEKDAAGRVVRADDETLTMRWTYRHEMRHLLELCGFDVEAEHSDFRRSPPAYGAEQVWIARRRA